MALNILNLNASSKTTKVNDNLTIRRSFYREGKLCEILVCEAIAVLCSGTTFTKHQYRITSLIGSSIRKFTISIEISKDVIVTSSKEVNICITRIFTFYLHSNNISTTFTNIYNLVHTVFQSVHTCIYRYATILKYRENI